jgi:hypothetical protein
MSVITTKFSVNDVCYTFDSFQGIIYRHTVKEIGTTVKNNDIEISYDLTGTTPPLAQRTKDREYEQSLYTETEVKDLANTWLINKSISIFSNAGL